MHKRIVLIASFCAALASAASMEVVAAAPAATAKREAIVAAAKKEGRVIVYATLDPRLARYLVDDFEQMYPEIKVAYSVLDPARLQERFTRENAADGHSADVVWSAAMDTQMRCVSMGCALKYRSPEAAALPKWAQWQDQVYGTTYEPIAIVYNRRFVAREEVPTSRRALMQLLKANPEKYQGKLSTYDPGQTALGGLLLALDATYDAQFWQLAKTMGARGLQGQTSTDTIFDRISTGKDLIAYDILGSDAIKRAKRDPTVGVQYTVDYNLVLSRLMFIAKTAQNPNAAKLWLDYVLSKRGQQQMQVADLYPIRTDVTGTDPGLAALRMLPKVEKPISASVDVGQIADPARRSKFEQRWKAAMEARQ